MEPSNGQGTSASWRGAIRGPALVALVGFVPAALYVAAFNGITCSNDGSHYALLRSIADTGSPVVDRYVAFTEHNDVSSANGHFYSDRPPGTAVLALPFYFLGRVLPAPQVPSKWDAGNRGLFWVLLAPMASVFLLAWLFWRQQLALGVRPLFAVTGVLTLLLATTLWKYGTVLFSHGLCASLVFASVAMAMRREPLGWKAALGTGLMLGTLPTLEYQMSVPVAVTGLWLLLSRRVRGAGAVAALVGGGALALAALLLYFKLNFGGWFATSYSARVNDPWTTASGTFARSMAEGFVGLLFGSKLNHGWLMRMPFLLFGLAGFVVAYRRGARSVLLPAAILVTIVPLLSSYTVYDGNTGDGRYLVPFIALALLPAPLLLQAAFDRSKWLGGGLLALFLALAVWGALGTVSLLAHAFGMPRVHLPYAYSSWLQGLWPDLVQALPNVRAVPVFAAGYWLVAGVALAGLAWRRRASARQSARTSMAGQP